MSCYSTTIISYCSKVQDSSTVKDKGTGSTIKKNEVGSGRITWALLLEQLHPWHGKLPLETSLQSQKRGEGP